MRKDYRPKWSPITEVPVIPVHEDLDGRDAPSQHPIEAIDGLSDVLEAKVDKDATKQLSTEDYTSAEKAKLAGIAAGAEVNVISSVRINGAEVTPGADREVNLAVPTTGDMAGSVGLDRDGNLVLLDGDGNTMSTAPTGLDLAVVGATCSDGVLHLTDQRGRTTNVPLGFTEGAEPNRINGIKIDMVSLNPDSEGTVYLDVYTKLNSVQGASLDVSTGVVSLTNAGGTAISTMQTPIGESFVSASYDPEHVRLDLVKADGTHAYVDLQALYTPYMSGDGIVISADGPGGRERINLDARTDFLLGHAVQDFGDQRIEGAKTFAGDLASTGNPAGLKLQSDKGSYDSGQATVVQHYLATPDGYSLTAYDDVYLQGSRVLRRIKLTGRDGTTHTLALSAGDDGAGYAIAPSYTPQNEGGQYVAPSDGTTVITQGMLAVSPTVMHRTGDESVAGTKDFTGTITESGAVSSKSVVTPGVQNGAGWYKAYEISVTTTVTHTLVLWSSPTSPVAGSSYPMGVLVASIRGSSCVLKWETGMAGAEEADLQKTALVCTQTGEGAYTWALWQKAEGSSIGRYLHRMAEYTMNGPSSGWAVLTPSASDAQASLPSGEGITVHYSEA